MDQARKLEDLGYSSLTVPDHLAEMFAPMPALVSAAAATKGIRVGTTVLNNDFRHPVLLAREAATVDLLTDGRLELGLGAGYVKSEYEQAGLRFDPGGARGERLAEAAVIVKRLLAGERLAFTYSKRSGLEKRRPVPAKSSPMWRSCVNSRDGSSSLVSRRPR